jgi:hypothetical protein
MLENAVATISLSVRQRTDVQRVLRIRGAIQP